MRIDRLKLPDFRNLKDFEIKFDESQPTTVILGRNGSGKSNLIEALVEIFRDLEDGKASTFAYEIAYLCHGHRVEVINEPKGKKHEQYSVDGAAVSRAEFHALHDKVLPKHVFAYYSGWNRRLESGFDEPTRSLYMKWLNNEDRDIPLRRLFYCRKEYSQFVLLAFFLSNNPSAGQLLRDYLGIESFDSALFVLKTPYWRGSGKPNKVQLENGDSRFWYARGAFKHFLGRLWQNAMAPILNAETPERDFRGRKESVERLYLYIKDLEQLRTLSGDDSPKEFFGLLESLFLCDLIDEIRVSVQHTRAGRIRFEQLSEGEQQLLTVLGLMLFTQQDESLFLLDEPDTHLNPVWTYDFLSLLQQNIVADKAQLFIATHNPLLIGSLRKEQVRILSQEQGQTEGREPVEDPIGIGVEGLLRSELYGLRSTLAPEVLDKLDRHYLLLGKRDRSDEENIELMALATELNELSVARTHPNPYFAQFANAMARNATEPDQGLSKEDIKAQEKIADEVLAEILAEERSARSEVSK
jgi:predicted ATPase